MQSVILVDASILRTQGYATTLDSVVWAQDRGYHDTDFVVAYLLLLLGFGRAVRLDDGLSLASTLSFRSCVRVELRFYEDCIKCECTLQCFLLKPSPSEFSDSMPTRSACAVDSEERV